MIDNFELIKRMFYFNEADNMFFHCQIVQRAKDHKPNKVREGAIKTYFIRSKEHLDKVKEEIILLCEHYGARAYINVAGKDLSSLNSLLLLKLADDNNKGLVRNPRKLLNSAAGELISRNKKWIVDIDDINLKQPIEDWLNNYFWTNIPISLTTTEEGIKIAPNPYTKTNLYKIYNTIPTKNGIHFITVPFNVEEFTKKFPNVDVHKNSMGTLLYYPKSLELPKYCCSICGGTNIQLQAWIDPNNNNKYIQDTEDDICWCEDCQEHTKVKSINNEAVTNQ